MLSEDEHFSALITQSSKLIQQASKYLINCDDDNDDNDNNNVEGNGNGQHKKRCLEAISLSNEAILKASDNILTKKMKLKLKKEQEYHKEKEVFQIARSTSYLRFDNIIGSDDAKVALYENMILPLSMPPEERKKVYQGVLAGGGNVLLYGPPGTGKTCLAQAAATEAEAEFFAIRPSDILRSN